jgi:hypothetical protein
MKLAPYKSIFLLDLFYVSQYFKYIEFPYYIGLYIYISVQEKCNINSKDLSSSKDFYKK